MSIFDRVLNAGTPDEQTLVEKKKIVANHISGLSENLLVNVINQRNQAFNAFWGVEGGFTPQQKLKALRENNINVEEMFEEDRALVAFLTDRLKKRGAKDEQVGRIFARIPEQYEVSMVDDQVAITDK